MKLYIPTLDATLVEVDHASGRVRFEGEEWSTPTLQERRAILHAARQVIDELQEAERALDRPAPGSSRL